MSDKIERIEPEKRRGGEWVVFGLDEYRVPPLGVYEIKDLKAEIELTQDSSIPQIDERRWTAMIKVIHAALKRNYPSITIETVQEIVDVENIKAALNTVFAVSGFKKAQGPGEPEASTGTPSTSA